MGGKEEVFIFNGNKSSKHMHKLISIIFFKHYVDWLVLFYYFFSESQIDDLKGKTDTWHQGGPGPVEDTSTEPHHRPCQSRDYDINYSPLYIYKCLVTEESLSINSFVLLFLKSKIV